MPKRTKRNPDKLLLFAFGALMLIGILALISASAEESNRDFGHIYGYFLHQLFYGIAIGGILAFFAYKFPYKRLEKLALPLFLFSIVLMILVFIPGIGIKIGGSQRWINLGFATFQPSELIKLAFTLYFALWLSSRVDEVRKARTLVPFLMLLGILIVLIMLQPDFGTMGIITFIALAMYFAAGAKFKDILYLGGLGVAAFYVLVKISPYRLNRLTTFLNPNHDPFGISYQINQTLIAVGSGQIFGTGPFQGLQKKILPLPMNDSIFAVWTEETGFIGALVVISLFLIIGWRGLRIATASGNNFAQFTAIGITVWFVMQAFVNMGAIMGIIPLTGVTLPLISYGSSSLILTLIAAGLLLQLSRETK